MMSLCEPLFAIRSWQNSLWKCVPTIVSVSPLRGLVEQNEDIPVPRGRGGLVGRRGLQGFSLNRIQQRFLEQITLTFQFRVVEVFKVLVMDRVQQLSSSHSGFCRVAVFRTFSKTKKSADFTPSTPPAQLASPFLQEGFWEDEAGGMWMRLPSGRWYFLCSEPEVYKDVPWA